jgi:iron complex transport system substrate-binding protein
MSCQLRRIVCLSAEAADWLYRLGVWDRVVGVTAFFKPPEGAQRKPCVGGFSKSRIEDIAALDPDLIITFSDVQAGIAAELLRSGFAVLGTNQGTLAEITSTLALLGKIVDREAEAARLLRQFERKLAPVGAVAVRPRVYFEEWNEPLICGITWVSELIERAGGADAFAELHGKKAASERVVSTEEVLRRDPEIILASWCGRPVRVAQIANRPQWKNLTAVRDGRIREIPAADILQPGFRLIYGFERIKHWIVETIEGKNHRSETDRVGG